MSPNPKRALVFYLLESTSAAITPDTTRYTAEVLKGYKADFWADDEPYLTVLEVEDFMERSRKVEDELSDMAARAELQRIRSWIRTGGQPIVGYQVETA